MKGKAHFVLKWSMMTSANQLSDMQISAILNIIEPGPGIRPYLLVSQAHHILPKFFFELAGAVSPVFSHVI